MAVAGNGYYRPDNADESDPEDDGVLDASDTLDGNPGDDPLDQGIVPPDRWSAGEGFGTTLAEERAGESLDLLLAQEVPDLDPYAEADTEVLPDGSRPRDAPAERRAGRLLTADEGTHPRPARDLVAREVGIDGGAATAEEAAVHVTENAPDPAD